MYQTLELYFEGLTNFDEPEEWNVLIHDKNGAIDDLYIHPSFSVKLNPWYSKHFEIRGRRISKTSTKPRPCGQFWPRANHEVFLRANATREKKCVMPPTLNSVTELDHNIIEVSF